MIKFIRVSDRIRYCLIGRYLFIWRKVKDGRNFFFFVGIFVFEAIVFFFFNCVYFIYKDVYIYVDIDGSIIYRYSNVYLIYYEK